MKKKAKIKLKNTWPDRWAFPSCQCGTGATNANLQEKTIGGPSDGTSELNPRAEEIILDRIGLRNN